MVKKQEVHFVFVNPASFSCLELMYQVLATLTITRRLQNGDVFDGLGGVIIARHDNEKINSIDDLEDKTISASSLLLAASGQVQAMVSMNAFFFFATDQHTVMLKDMYASHCTACLTVCFKHLCFSRLCLARSYLPLQPQRQAYVLCCTRVSVIMASCSRPGKPRMNIVYRASKPGGSVISQA